MIRSILLLALVGLLCSGCGATIHERHYFATFDKGRPTEFFRLTVDGSAGMSSARFVSGYYDERALDLFFNQMRSGSDYKSSQLFKCPDTGCTEAIAPLNADQQHGAYMLIMSNNADSVANAIGSFAGNEVVGEAVSNLVNRDAIKTQRRFTALSNRQERRGALTATSVEVFRNQAAALPAGDAADKAYARALSALAQYLGGDVSFSSMKEAELWFDAEARVARKGR